MLGRLHRSRSRRHRHDRASRIRTGPRRFRRVAGRRPGLRHLAGSRGWIGVTDATLTARGTGGPPRLAELTDADDHPRVRHARWLRTNVQVRGDERGLITLADGLAGRRELSIELHRAQDSSRGHGRSLLSDAFRWSRTANRSSPPFPRATPAPCAPSSPADSRPSAARYCCVPSGGNRSTGGPVRQLSIPGPRW